MKRKYKNILLLIILIICTIVASHDLYIIVIQPWITHKTAGWTWFGFITFIIALASGLSIVDYFIKEKSK